MASLIAARRPPPAAEVAAERPPSAAQPAELRGVAASPGLHHGVAQVVLTLEQAQSLGREQILVCEMTSPAWLPLLMVAGSVVTDRGGALSHAAIVAREFGIPAVTGTRRATGVMVSGQPSEVNGTTGSVRARS
ncbi:MAG: PEP-utilizing enzyme [Jatrophihabitantaceae bacterium]